jgi:hypothetical protein
VPTNGTIPAKQADANTAMSQVSTTRLGTAPTNGTTPVARDDANTVMGQVSTTRLGTAPTNGTTPPRREPNDPIPGIDVIVHKQPTGKGLHVTTDGKGTASIGKLARGESYDIQIMGKDLEPALDRVAGGKTGGGTAKPQQVLIALLLPAVQQARSIPASSTQRAFARGKEQVIHLTIAMAKDGTATIDWGDGSGRLSLGEYHGNTSVNMGLTALVRGDANSVVSQESLPR